MPVFDARDILSFDRGDNDTDTVIAGIHFNLTALQHWNFTLYSNGTLSNGSRCLLTSGPYGDFTPKYVFPNGTFLNTTSCYSPIKPISTRGFISIGLAVVFGLALIFTLICLRRHGRMYLPTEKRFRPVGRRWQWYWMIAMCATGFISLVTNIDVDRYFLPEIPIVLTSFFWFLMNLCTMACVWEAVRHWGSWQERQFIDPDPFRLKMDDKRAKFEFWVPLFFYLWWWLDFFMGIPRNWGSLELQRYPEQTRLRAAPGATDNRLKAAAFLLLMCWLTTVYYLRHSIKHYKERNRGIFNRAVGFVKFTPYRFMLILPLALSVVAYQALSAWEFQYSVMDIRGDNVSTFVGGYAPALLIMLVQIVAGFLNPNEDRELIRQRRIRGAAADHELGVVRKPAWWRRANGEVHDGETMRERIARNVREVGGGRATAKNIDEMHEVRTREAGSASAPADVEAGQVRRTASNAGGGGAVGAAARPTPGGGVTTYSGSNNDRRRTEQAMQAVAGLLFPSAGNPQGFVDRVSYISADGPPPPYPEPQAQPKPQQPPQHQEEAERGRQRSDDSIRATAAERSTSANTSNSLASPPQQIKSMLDV
ncbi:hypothetical protein KVR01_013641 [Diaporthe batatas]|uniref:uncharacterized protein n=1 Tax=Diaporthe batatas TaxID=748121 RepID=UPI001D04A3B2|nr:uncharacterized protein KVR01_013641 [Diaporthe batatas]KAG8156537.1 hypothetical protein KVR01_013641 [Diaporthe batatas]